MAGFSIRVLNLFFSLFGIYKDVKILIVNKGINKENGKIVSEPGVDVEYISGSDILSNNQVNFLSCLIIALTAPHFSLKLYKNII